MEPVTTVEELLGVLGDVSIEDVVGRVGSTVEELMNAVEVYSVDDGGVEGSTVEELKEVVGESSVDDDGDVVGSTVEELKDVVGESSVDDDGVAGSTVEEFMDALELPWIKDVGSDTVSVVDGLSVVLDIFSLEFADRDVVDSITEVVLSRSVVDDAVTADRLLELEEVW